MNECIKTKVQLSIVYAKYWNNTASDAMDSHLRSCSSSNENHRLNCFLRRDGLLHHTIVAVPVASVSVNALCQKRQLFKISCFASFVLTLKSQTLRINLKN